MNLNIDVVMYQGEKWFEVTGVKFDTLSATWDFVWKDFQVFRAGNVIANGRVSEARGEAVFNDYKEGGAIRLQGSALHAEDFKVGDRLELVDLPDGFDLVKDLKRACWFQQGMLATVPVGKEMPVQAMLDLMAPKLDSTRDVAAAAQVLRFRRSK